MKDNYLVLIVDDNANNLRLLGSMLSRNGYKIALATNGQECLNFMEKQIPDLIFLDIMMPDINGFDVCKTLKANKRTAITPIIFLSALSNTKQIVKAFESGGSDYVTKPFSKDEIIARSVVHINVKKEKENFINSINELKAKIKILEEKE